LANPSNISTYSRPNTTSKGRGSSATSKLAERLEFHRLRSGDRKAGPMFTNTAKNRLNLNNLLNRQILPALNVCKVCGVAEGREHLKQDHNYERNDSIPAWHGFHACRRGLGSNLYRLRVPDKVIQAILRHSNVNVTLGYYVKSTSSDVVEAMEKFEENFDQKTAVHTSQDSVETVKPNSGATPEFVN
jgi:integrase